MSLVPETERSVPRVTRKRGFFRRVGKLVVAAWLSRVCPVVLLCIVVLLMMLDLWGLRVFGGGVVDYQRLGDIGTWVQGIGTVAAVAVALILPRRDRLRREERDRTQVYCWVAFEQEAAVPGWFLHFSNSTPMPVQLWSLEVRDDLLKQEIRFDVSLGGPIRTGSSEIRLTVEPSGLEKPQCELSFVDTVGGCWRRLSSGALQRADRVVVNGQVVAETVS